MWYVVQVPAGREEYLCRLIQRVAAEVAQRERAEELQEGAGGQTLPAGSQIDRVPAEKAPVLDECFVPTCEFERKRRGEWKRVRLPMFPGYVIAVTRDVGRLQELLRRVPEFTKLLRMGESFTPLSDAEIGRIQAYAGGVEHSMAMSYGVMEGDQVRIVEGPLLGCEGQIVEIKRRAGVAILEMHMFGRTMRTRVGLAIVAKRNGQRPGRREDGCSR